MRYPVGNGTQADFDKHWYIASFFGEYRGNYYHSGDDYNLRTGGNTDLGQALRAISDGEILGIDNTSITGFGKQIYLKFKVDGKDYFAGYNHCDSIAVKSGDKVKEGDLLGTLGKSGTTWAHLHFSIKNNANGMDNVPNTKEELAQWENPTLFIKKYLNESEDNNMIEVPSADFEKLVKNSSEYDKFVEAGYSSVNDVKELEQKIKELEAHKCPIIETPEPITELKLKERIEESVEDDVKIIRKYSL